MKEMIAVLHNIRSIHNVGSMFRTADSAGIKKVYLCGITPIPLDRFGKVRQDFSKVSLGAERFVEWEYKRSVATVVNALKKEGYIICAVEQSKNSKPYYSIRKRERNIALIMGNEVGGLPKPLLNKVDEILEIPMHGGKESLNVSVAFGIVAYGVKY